MVETKSGVGTTKPGEKKETPTPTTGSKIWNESEVKLLKKWAELSASYRVLHDRAHRIFKFKNQCFTIPVIVLSTILGTASFSQSTFPPAYQPYIPMGIGSLNIIAGIITTIAQFTRVSELSEANRVASIAYGKFSRNIATELSLPPEFRSYSGIDFVQICRSEFDRLVEQSPIIPLDILEKFMQEIDGQDITKPDIMTVTKIEEYRPTKEEKAASIIANAFQKMHNRAQDDKKSGVQKMAEMVEKKGLQTVHRIQNMMTPPALKEIEHKVGDNVEKKVNQIADGATKLTGFVAKQVESKKNELNNMVGSGLVAKMIQKNNSKSDIKEKDIPVPSPSLNIPSVKNIKSNVLNIIHKAKNNLEEEVKEGYEEIKSDVENILQNDENDSTKDSSS